MIDAVEILSRVCALIAKGDQAAAEGTINRDYPFVSMLPTLRGYREPSAMRVFNRDGFVDRYTGD